MFTIKIKHLIYVSERIIIRNLRNRRQPEVNGQNPGLNNRIRAFQEQGIKIEDEDAEEFVESSDSNFFNVGGAYNEHLNETLMGKYDLQHKIVKQKYFKDNLPNLLTWSEKEQIRHLATAHPDEWTPERIAESFPVTAQVAKKLLKYPWKPATEERIARHDASALRNWKDLKENKLDIPEDLHKHLLKFSERKIPPLNKKSVKVDLTQTEKIGQFEEIVFRCSKQDNAEKTSEKVDSNENISNNAKKIKVNKDPQRITLGNLTAQIKKRLDGGDCVDMSDKIIIETVNKNNVEIENSNVNFMSSESKRAELKEYQEDTKEINLFDYPERIRIPKNIYKKGATYKIKDCYYDHDGKFLYRVLGASQ